MPPRYAYWTILIDDKPTAFRARERDELQPTFVQLQRKNTNVTMRWFARGKLWASREAERDDFQTQKHAANAPREPRGERPEGGERRGSDWRPGGSHKDPRDRFKKKNRPERAWSEKDPATQRDRDRPGYVAKKPWQDKPRGEGKAPWSGRPREPHGSSRDSRANEGRPNDRPWQTKPTGPRAQRKPWVGKPSSDAPRGDRPPVHRSSSDRQPSGGGWNNKPAGEGKRPWSGKPSDRPGPPRERKPWNDKATSGPPRGDRPWSNKPAGDAPRGDRPWRDKPAGGPPRGDRPWNSKPAGGPPRGDRPWRDKPAGGPPRGDRPWNNKPAGGAPRGDRPWRDKPAGGPPRGDRPWSSKPAGGPPRGDRPPTVHRNSSDRPRSEGGKKRRDDDPDRD